MPDANTVAIGADGNDANGTDAGHVRIYEWNGSAWAQKGADIDGESAGDNSGWSISMPDANTLAIGAVWNDGNGADAGHVRIYAWSGSAWLQKGVDIDGEAADNRSGWSVSMPDTGTVAIGAYYNDGNGIDAGHVRVYGFVGVGIVGTGVGSAAVVFPNPGSGKFTVEHQGADMLSYVVSDITGKPVLTGTMDRSPATIDLTSSPAGIYHVELGSKGQVVHRQELIKE